MRLTVLNILATLTVAMAGSTAVLAQDMSAAPAAPAPTAKPVKEKKICHQDTDTGSIMPKTTCHTRAEWAEIEKANSENAAQYSEARHQAGGH